MASMFLSVYQLKVLDSIIKFVTINMMNEFTWKKFSTQMFGHHYSMDWLGFSFVHSYIISFINPYSIPFVNGFVGISMSDKPLIVGITKTHCSMFLVASFYGTFRSFWAERSPTKRITMFYKSIVMRSAHSFCMSLSMAIRTLFHANDITFFQPFVNNRIFYDQSFSSKMEAVI